LSALQQLDLFSARSARAKGSGDPAPVPLILWTPYPLPAPGLRARTRDTHKSIHISYANKQVGAPGDAPFLCAGRHGCFVGAGHAPPAARNHDSQPLQNSKLLYYPCRGRPVCRPAAYMPLPQGAWRARAIEKAEGFQPFRLCYFPFRTQSPDHRSLPDIPGLPPVPPAHAAADWHCGRND